MDRVEKRLLPGAEGMVRGCRAPLSCVWLFIPALGTSDLTPCERRIITCISCLSHSQRTGKAPQTEWTGHYEAFG